MYKRTIPLLTTIAAAGLLGACASDPTGLMTSSLAPDAAPAQTTAAAAMPPLSKVDPACVTLLSQIEQMRKDGVSDRVQKASLGKAKSVTVKRATLVKAAELDKANAEYQAKCSTLSPRQTAAQANPVANAVTGAATTAAASAAGSAVTAAAAKAADAMPKLP